MEIFGYTDHLLKRKNFTLEYRFDQQLIVTSSLWKFGVTQRFRIESS